MFSNWETDWKNSQNPYLKAFATNATQEKEPAKKRGPRTPRAPKQVPSYAPQRTAPSAPPTDAVPYKRPPRAPRKVAEQPPPPPVQQVHIEPQPVVKTRKPKKPKVRIPQGATKDGLGYCRRCNSWNKLSSPTHSTAKNGAARVSGTCATCGGRVNSFLSGA